MSGLLESLLRYPTVIFTGFMLVAVAFWLFTMVGGLDFDLFDVDVGGDVDLDVDVDGPEGGGTSLFEALGLSGVPVTIALTLLVFFGWVMSLFLTEAFDDYLSEHFPDRTWFWGVGIGAFLLSIPLAALAIRPVRKALRTQQAVRKHELIGSICRITTQKVTASFGQAEIQDGQAGIVVQVRCDHANRLTLHSRAIVVGFDPGEDAFDVEPDDGPSQDRK